VEAIAIDPESGIEGVYRAQRDRLWRSLVLSFGDREVASDSMAEAFAQLIARGDGVRDPEAWVWRSAFRIAAGQMARRTPGQLPVDVVDDNLVEVVEVLDALARLSPEQRTAVVLADYAGYRHAEIARLVGSSPGAVAVRVHRGRRRLRVLLEVRDD
jgi:RNA polymerase sigma-70 factor (ECF subfamily)